VHHAGTSWARHGCAWARVGVALLCACALGGAVASAEDGGDAARDLRAAARSPLASERYAAERRLVERGADALQLVRTWVRDPDPRLRAVGWRVLAVTGTANDLRAALRALSDSQPQVGHAAAEAVVALASALPVPDEPWLPRDALPAAGIRPLALALGVRLDEVTRDAVPVCLHRLGEGVVPALRHLCRHPRYGESARARALAALARVGGEQARETLAYQWTALPERRAGPWWRALIEVGPGPGLEAAYGIAAEFPARARDSYGERVGNWMHWREQEAFFRFLSTCPPPGEASELRWFVGRFLDPRTRRGTPKLPSLVIEIVRALLVLEEPTDLSLFRALYATTQRAYGRSKLRAEEYARILMLLEPYKERPSLRDDLTWLLEQDALPNAVRAWALYLHGDADRADLAARATALIQPESGAVTVAQRRAGIELWRRLGRPPPDLIEALRADYDPFARVTALGWTVQAADDGRLSAEERTTALAMALADADDDVFLAASEHHPGDPGAAARARLMALALEGARAVRGRAWRVLARLAGRAAYRLDPPFVAPTADAGLDERLRAAAVLRRRFAR
jgi:hypothetical protein